jgi:hypothetical protein
MYWTGETSHRRDTENTERAQSFILLCAISVVLCVSAVNLLSFPYTQLRLLYQTLINAYAAVCKEDAWECEQYP